MARRSSCRNDSQLCNILMRISGGVNVGKPVFGTVAILRDGYVHPLALPLCQDLAVSGKMNGGMEADEKKWL